MHASDMAYPARSLLLFSIVALLTACGQTPPAANSGATAAAPASPASATAAAGERVVCEETPLTGSRLNTPRRCRTISSTNDPQRDATGAINEVRQNQAMPRK